ncbi:phage head closure protein [Paenibacillus oenotherae]|uniref:Phage head closure protein n=1 Tax=Paenibacillus oenotherae TaxID=1435645 RepID=A0ABS7D8U2_9BACL|nr:phage head closure protein [Paenibacillus oenotherae]MBW7475947.1 phage head closure protein [Paenibacillus oenotherae]
MTILVNRLDKRVKVYRPPGPEETDEYGEPLNVPIEVCNIWAAIEPLQGREYFAAMQVNAEVTTRIRIRYREGVDRTMFVKHKGLEFEILYTINPKFENKEIQLMCKERQ